VTIPADFERSIISLYGLAVSFAYELILKTGKHVAETDRDKLDGRIRKYFNKLDTTLEGLNIPLIIQVSL